MGYIEKEKMIKADIASIENTVRHAFNQGYDLGYKEGKSNLVLSNISLDAYIDKINKMKSEIADALEFWDYSPNNNPLARDMLETITNFWGDMSGDEV
jgi:hypothetical protein